MKKYDLAIVVLLLACASFAFFALTNVQGAEGIRHNPLSSAQDSEPTNQQYKPAANNLTRSKLALPSNYGFIGTMTLDPNQCYEGETIGDCAARAVQRKVLDLYVFLFIIGLVETAIGVLTVGVLFRQTRIANRQAEISKQAMTIGQWPFLFVDSHRFIMPWERAPESTIPSCEFSAKVHGSSPAILRRFYGILAFGEAVPPAPNPIDLGWDILDIRRLPGTVWDGTTQYRGDMEHLSGPRANQSMLFLVGVFVYDDLFGNQHEMGFCYVAGRHGGQGMIHGGANYNYHRLRKPDERI